MNRRNCSKTPVWCPQQDDRRTLGAGRGCSCSTPSQIVGMSWSRSHFCQSFSPGEEANEDMSAQLDSPRRDQDPARPPIGDADLDAFAEQLARIIYRQIMESGSETPFRRRATRALSDFLICSSLAASSFIYPWSARVRVSGRVFGSQFGSVRTDSSLLQCHGLIGVRDRTERSPDL